MIGRAFAAGLMTVALAAGGAAAQEWLALCSKCLSPSIYSKTGAGTANAVALARITEADARGWCENWLPGDRDCVREQMSTPEAKQSYRASADCPAGRITTVDGKTYRQDGVWPPGDIGAGRARFRDAAGRIIGRDNASGGLGISQQWEVLCPKPAVVRPAAPTPAPQTALPAASALFGVGQPIEARYGSQWVRGQVVSIRQVTTARGTETQYEVVLENRKRGIVPVRMLRLPMP